VVPRRRTPGTEFRGEPGWLTREYVRTTAASAPAAILPPAGKFEDYLPVEPAGGEPPAAGRLTSKGYRVEYREFTGGTTR
jgi:hypothetical protein